MVTGGTINTTTSVLTLTNNLGSEATLRFKWSQSCTNSWKAGTISGAISSSSNNSGNYEGTLAAGESITITYKSPKNATSTLSITELSLISTTAADLNVTFMAPTNGSYTVDDTPITTKTVKSVTAGATINLKASANSNYKFYAWQKSDGTYISYNASYTMLAFEDETITPVFINKDIATFMVNDQYFVDLDDAVDYATANSVKQINLYSSGKISDPSYEIPAGYTLLIPRDTNYTAHGANPEFKGSVTAATEVPDPTEFRRLTLASGTTLTVNGTIEVEGMHKTMQGGNPYSNKVCGPYAAIYMEDRSNITLNSGATLYAWGYIFGSGNSATEGTVTALSDSTVYEYMQVPDFPGGSKLSGFVDTAKDTDANGDGNNANDYVKAFPFSQYYIQNIEVPLTIHSGATENIYMTMTMDAKVTVVDIGSVIKFVGDGGMFDSEAGGTLVKDYVPSTDRLVLTANGNASINSIELDMSNSSWSWALSLVVGTTKINSADYIFSLNGNMSINANSGTITIGQDVSMLPGVEINVAEGAELVLKNNPNAGILNVDEGNTGGYNVYVYDLDQWGANVFQNVKLIAAQYSPTPGRYVRTEADLKDVVIDVNGTVKSEGYLYTTTGGASIISSEGTGKIIMENGAGSATKAYCLTGTADESTVSVVSAMLKNGDGTYLQTAGTEAGATFTYCTTCDKWVAQEYTLSFNANPGELTATGEMESIKIHEGCIGKLPANAFAIADMKFTGWNTVAAPTEEAPGVAITVEEGQEITIADIYASLTADLPADTTEITLYAQWEAANINVITLKEGVISYTVSGQTVTVKHNIACKVGYWDEANSKYVAIKNPVANADGSCSFTAEDGITEVLLVVKGDINGDGKTSSADTGPINAHIIGRRALAANLQFAGDINEDNKLSSADTGPINAQIIGRRSLPWG